MSTRGDLPSDRVTAKYSIEGGDTLGLPSILRYDPGQGWAGSSNPTGSDGHCSGPTEPELETSGGPTRTGGRFVLLFQEVGSRFVGMKCVPVGMARSQSRVDRGLPGQSDEYPLFHPSFS